jgi:hypothetical protein
MTVSTIGGIMADVSQFLSRTPKGLKTFDLVEEERPSIGGGGTRVDWGPVLEYIQTKMYDKWVKIGEFEKKNNANSASGSIREYIKNNSTPGNWKISLRGTKVYIRVSP